MLGIVSAGLAFCAWSAAAQRGSKAPPLSIAHVALRVADLSASRAFYSSLGYQEAFALDKGGSPTEAFFKVNDRQFIELYPKRRVDQAIGFLHVCFEAHDLAALNQFYSARGLHPTPVKRAAAGNLLFTMRGPEQQNMEFTQYMPGSRHSLDIGKHLGANRIADSIAGVQIPMRDVPEADSLYRNSMQFEALRRGHEGRTHAFALPGESHEEVVILSVQHEASFHLLLWVADLQQARQKLKSRSIPVHRKGHELVVHDPDGNVIFFELAPEARGLHS